jgi:hypothetical protein
MPFGELMPSSGTTISTARQRDEARPGSAIKHGPHDQEHVQEHLQHRSA